MFSRGWSVARRIPPAELLEQLGVDLSFHRAELDRLKREGYLRNVATEGDGKTLIAEKCASCHDLRRVVVKRSNGDDWAHTITRMRTRMMAANNPDLTDAEYTKAIEARKSLQKKAPRMTAAQQ